MYEIPRPLLDESFKWLRACGRGSCECQVLWTSKWDEPVRISRVVHPSHSSHAGGFQLESAWITKFWFELSARNEGIRVQVHTHPGEAFHSATDDAFPVINTPGFLSLVIPDYGLGTVGFDDAFLAVIDEAGRWRTAEISRYFRVTD